MGNHTLGSFGQSVALQGALFTNFALKSDSALQDKKLQINFFQKSLDKNFSNSGFKLST